MKKEIKRKCLECKKEFICIPRNKLICSNECKIKRSRKIALKRVKKNKKGYSDGLIKFKCKNCIKEFIQINPNNVFCSKKCREIWYNNISLGIIISNDGKSFNYYKLRFEVFKRDNFTCQYCGRNVKEDKIKLHCDHIFPKSKGGDFVIENLITACEECNLGKCDILLNEKVKRR